ncbi:hypothetical protein [Pelagibacterium montanilacus]|uniref:Nmad2 family putative nucleotide modification protein n=1 Tax=Pelagibacterium montanilacus TaxID=2185280 RepID=UPI000F8DCCA2|nr:hypothetical protein [Pelagibacterium montanilacus]
MSFETDSKKPILNGSKSQHFGDNIYYTDAKGEIIQENSFHSGEDGILSPANLNRDTGTTDRVLLGRKFGYFGKSAPLIPPYLEKFIKKGPGHKSLFSLEQQESIRDWIRDLGVTGVAGEPARW